MLLFPEEEGLRKLTNEEDSNMSQSGQTQGKIAKTLGESIPPHLFTCDL